MSISARRLQRSAFDAGGSGNATTPGDVAGLTLWLKADAITGVANGARVASWSDSSGQGNNATNADNTSRPTYVTNVADGLPIVRFNDSSLVSAASSSASTQTVVAMVRPSTLSGVGTIRGGALQLRLNGGQPNVVQQSVRDLVIADRSVDIDHFQVVSFLFDAATTCTVRVGNMNSGTVATNIGSLDAATNTIGRHGVYGEAFSGDIAEIACWNRVLGEVELTAVITGLQQKWANGFTGDSVAPAAPVIVSSATTTNTTPIINGSAESNATIVLTVDSHTYTQTAAVDGSWSISITSPLVVGNSYPLSVTATDAAGNVSSTTTQTLNIVASLPPSTLPVPLKIMPLGDSITEGYPVEGGYRIALWDSLVNQDGRQIDFVGSQSNGPVQLTDHNHEGHGGWWIKDSGSGSDMYSNVASWFASAQPQMVLLHIGTNDLRVTDPYTCIQRLDDLVARIFSLSPDVRLIVAAIIPVQSQVYVSNQAYPNAVPGIVNKYQALGKKIYLADMRTVLQSSDYNDELHPALSGYNKMAVVWHSVVTSVMNNW